MFIPLAEVREKAARKVKSAASEGPDQALRAVSEVSKQHESLMEISGPHPEVACRRGCSYCCHLPRIVTTIPEVLSLVWWMREHFTPEDFAAMVRRVDDAYAKWKAIPAAEMNHRNLRCPLLVGSDTGGECGVHPAKPLSCKGYLAEDVGPCRAHYEEPGSGETVRNYSFSLTVRSSLAVAIHEGLQGKGKDRRGSPPKKPRDVQEVYLIPALWIALHAKDAVVRWFAGEQLFKPAWATQVPLSAVKSVVDRLGGGISVPDGPKTYRTLLASILSDIAGEDMSRRVDEFMARHPAMAIDDPVPDFEGTLAALRRERPAIAAELIRRA